jgi:hypothetical protein
MLLPAIWNGAALVCYNDVMETSYQTPLTPEQIAAVNAGGGYARCEDPTTREVYHLVRQGAAVLIDDEYVREKLLEAQADIDQGRVADWSLDEIRNELKQRIAGAAHRR